MKTCTKCKKEKTLNEFGVDRRRSRSMSACKSCRTESQRAWRKSKPGYEQARYQQDRQRARERHLVRKYGVTLAQYESMRAAQGGQCAICQAPEVDQFKGVFHVDHCHATGAVRGLLCRGCNHMLGVVGDDPTKLLRAVTYLKGPRVAAEVIAAYMECAPDVR